MKNEASKVRTRVSDSAESRKPDAYQVDRQGRAIVTIETLLKSKPFQEALERAEKAYARRKAPALG